MTSSPKEARMRELQIRAEQETMRERRAFPMIWGQGSLDATIALVGEGPGWREVAEGKPFVGSSGQLLRRELQSLGVSPDDVYLTNIVKIRVTTTSSSGRAANRRPTRKEVDMWMTYLVEELSIVEPSVIVCLGSVAGGALIGESFHMSKARGKWHKTPAGVPVIATYHPSYVMRYGAGESAKKDAFRADLREAIRKAGYGGNAEDGL